jgi:hypothetical protein
MVKQRRAHKRAVIQRREPYDPTLQRYLREVEAGVDTHLCETCRRLDFAAMLRIRPEDLYWPQKELLVARFPQPCTEGDVSPASNCTLCDLFARCLRLAGHSTKYPAELRLNDQSRFVLLPHRKYGYNSESFVFIPNEPLANNSLVRTSSVLNATNFEYLSREVSKCLKFCVKHSSIPDPKLPKWLVDCRELRIVRASSSMVYVAFSYVWGSEADIKLIEPLDQLPKTIADAVSATLALGQRYLWVDRYCIKQRDASEKAEDIANMADIFENSWVTIVSLGSGVRDGLGVSQRRMHISSIQTSQGRFVRDWDHRHHVQSVIQESAWVDRGWTLQEAALSKRLLIFAPTFTVLLCDRKSVFDHFGVHYPPREDGKMFMLGMGGRRDDRTLNVFSLLENYCRRNLALDEDNLLAVQSYLTRFCQVSHWGIPLLSPNSDSSESDSTEDTCSCFVKGLLWAALDRVASPKAAVSGFPSWSWASRRGRLSFEPRGKSVSRLDLCAKLSVGENATPLRNPTPDQVLKIQRSHLSQDRLLSIEGLMHPYKVLEEDDCAQGAFRVRMPWTRTRDTTTRLVLVPDDDVAVKEPCKEGTAVLMLVTKESNYLHAYWMAFEFTDRQARVGRRLGLVMTSRPKDPEGMDELWAALEEDWQNKKHERIRLICYGWTRLGTHSPPTISIQL